MCCAATSEIDLRTIAAQERHVLIFGRLGALLPGEALVITGDHDPVALRDQLTSRAPGHYQWAYLQAGPGLWRVQISRLETVAAEDEDACCSGGACC